MYKHANSWTIHHYMKSLSSIFLFTQPPPHLITSCSSYHFLFTILLPVHRITSCSPYHFLFNIVFHFCVFLSSSTFSAKRHSFSKTKIQAKVKWIKISEQFKLCTYSKLLAKHTLSNTQLKRTHCMEDIVKLKFKCTSLYKNHCATTCF